MDINKKYLDVVMNWKPHVKADNYDGGPDGLLDNGPDQPGLDTQIDLDPDDMEHLSPRQAAEVQAFTALVQKFGKYDQSQGPDGAHYDYDNPLGPEGISCNNCIFYEGAGNCNLVKGNIDPLGLCELNVIPRNKNVLTNTNPLPNATGV